MVNVLIKIEKELVIALMIDKFSEIEEEHMSIEKSDEMISDVIADKYGFRPDRIHVYREV